MAINPTLNAQGSSHKGIRISDKLPPRNWPALYQTDFAHVGADTEKNRVVYVNSSNGDESEPVRWSALA